ncbi:uncharacterized protein LOC127285063 [Leptopilina boulardi]|uniref:uncharacterized protein LOC127285063 n=1 Tax=Leptopilina boulardi TaxID=63433 RepID=UPI0021F68A7B|nr:uncharacterized protein LOC127285063 [Leptopilina boulardi]XP_051166825.1 uncharacterized protein LOC127285063 [Leptopilina boulardi]
MPSTCAAVGCKNVQDKRNPLFRFFRFPKNELYCKKWLNVCKNKNINVKNARICSMHFRADSYKPISFVDEILQTYKTTVRTLRDDAIPTENLCFPDAIVCENNNIKSSQNAKRTSPITSSPIASSSIASSSIESSPIASSPITSLPIASSPIASQLLDNDFLNSFQILINEIFVDFCKPEYREDLQKHLHILKKDFETEIENELKDESFFEMIVQRLDKSEEKVKKLQESMEKMEKKLRVEANNSNNLN